MISAKIIEDSISHSGVRITTMQLCYPRFIHAEFMTHRVFSRNASSSRAIPVAKMLEMVRNEPAMPIHWGKNQPGMQANEQLTGVALELAKEGWVTAALCAADIAEAMEKTGLHKQVANRILEPFQHIHVVVTATEWENFFALRDHEDAQPEIHELAIQMKIAMNTSTPKLLESSEWHLPYVTQEERDDAFFKIKANAMMLPKISAARCARVSYLKHDGELPNRDDDLFLYQRLAGGEPIHASPLEHQAAPDFQSFERQASPDFQNCEPTGKWGSPELHGNFTGWIQHRKLIEQDFKK